MINDEHPFVSIIFPNWNGKFDTLDCLKSLRELNYPKDRLEIIISDNGSSDGSQEKIKQKFSIMEADDWYALKLVENKKNLGASLARNKGIKAIFQGTKYIWLLDNDVIVDKNSLKELLKIFINDEKIGILGSINYYFDNPKMLWPNGGKINKRTGRINYINEKDIKISNIINVDYVSTSSALIKNETIQEIGLFDPDYFCYYNDTDICVRLNKAGYKNYLVSSSKVWHKVSNTSKKISGFEIYFKTRNYIIFMRKNSSHCSYLIFLVYFLFFLPYFISILFYQKSISNLNFFFKGLIDGIFFKKFSKHKNFNI